MIFFLQHIESRLRITLPEDLPFALQDGVVLCHIANHVKPRAVPSIHVPSPAVVRNISQSHQVSIRRYKSLFFQPKLNVAKCRRNVENFLLACRKMGVREVRPNQSQLNAYLCTNLTTNKERER